MAEVIALVASVIAVIQISDRVIELCKYYIGSSTEAPASLRAVFIEISTLKTVFEALQFLEKCAHSTPALWKQISSPSGPIEGCRSSLNELEKLFPQEYAQHGGQNAHASRRQKIRGALTALAWPLKQNRAQELLQRISKYKAAIQIALTTESSQDIKDIKATTEEINMKLTEAQRQKVCKWLVQTDPSPLHNHARRLYESGTGSWMLRTSEWSNWLAGIQRCVWIHGIPGAGKTILASWLIEQVQDHCKQKLSQKSICAYYYCYFGHNQDEAMPFLRWIINQLIRHTEVVPTRVYDLFKHDEEPDIPELLASLELVLRPWSVVYIVIDAIDESDPRNDLLEIIRDLSTSLKFQKIHMLVTSREYRDIERVMEGCAEPVSMSNSLVEGDIRIYVHSAIQSNIKFKRWPKDLLSEIEDAVSTKAKGMFRWAVCQLDELQRLKSDSSVVRSALANLPKDLDETYERVLLRIPKKEWPFACHLFYWFRCYCQLGIHEDGIPCMLLLDAIRASLIRTGFSIESVYYDSERLKEICGCLINVGEGDLECEILITFAHYTVKEYLESPRLLQSRASFFSVQLSEILPICLGVVFSEALTVQPCDPEHRKLNITCQGGTCWQYMAHDLSLHCALCVLLSMNTFSAEIAMNENLFTLVKSLLQPSRQFFKVIVNCLGEEHGYYLKRIFYGVANPDTAAESIVWNPNAADIDVGVLLNLLLISDDKISPLTSKFLEELDHKTLLNGNAVLKKGLWVVIDKKDHYRQREVYEFRGSAIEVMSQLVDHHLHSFRYLLENCPGCYDPTTILLHFIGRHGTCSGFPYSCDNQPSCLVRTLLLAGAEPNPSGYRVSPLQIAVAAWDLEGVQLLLEFGANPNCTGDPCGIIWPDNSPHARYNSLHGKPPLQICRTKECFHGPTNYIRVERAPALKPIGRLLLQYGADGTLCQRCGGNELPPCEWCSGDEDEGSNGEASKTESAS